MLQPRTFEIIRGDDKISVKNTTFVLGADVTAKTTDEVKLLGTNKNSGETVTNYIQLGELPREVSSKYLETPLEFGNGCCDTGWHQFHYGEYSF